MTSEQLEYVKGELAKGIAQDLVKLTLLDNGYTEDLVNQLFNAVTSGVPVANAVQQPVVVQKEGPSIFKIVLIVIGVLVSILVIGGIVLALVVSASLNTAREEGQEAANKLNLNNFRAQAEIYYDDNNFSYEGACGELAPIKDTKCIDETETYQANIKLNNGTMYCVDSTGFAGIVSGVPDTASCS